MKQYTEVQTFKVSKEMDNWLGILKTKYHIKTSTFIRNAIIEKLKKDVPKLREQKTKIKLPF